MPMALVAGKRMVWTPISPLEEIHHPAGLVGAGLVLDAGVDVLGVLAEDHHVHVLGRLDRRGHAREVAHRADAGVEVELLPERHVERAEAAADRRGERALDGDQVIGRSRPGCRPAASCSSDPWPSRRPAPRARRSGACRRRPAATASSKTYWDARQMSGPVPSPSMNGMTGWAGTSSRPSAHRDRRRHRVGQMRSAGAGGSWHDAVPLASWPMSCGDVSPLNLAGWPMNGNTTLRPVAAAVASIHAAYDEVRARLRGDHPAGPRAASSGATGRRPGRRHRAAGALRIHVDARGGRRARHPGGRADGADGLGAPCKCPPRRAGPPAGPTPSWRETFFNSVTRRVFSTVGVDAAIEYLDPAIRRPTRDGRAALDTDRCGGRGCPTVGAPAAPAAVSPGRCPRPSWSGTRSWWRSSMDAPGSREPGRRPDRARHAALGVLPQQGRVPGRADPARRRDPPAGAAAAPRRARDRGGRGADDPDEASVVFGFSWTYFRVDAPRPRALVDFLASIMPLKRLRRAVHLDRLQQAREDRALPESHAPPGGAGRTVRLRRRATRGW